MNNLTIIPTDSSASHSGNMEPSRHVFQLAAIKIPATTELTEEELRLWYYLAPFAVDHARIHYDIEEVHANFIDYLPPLDSFIEGLAEANTIAFLPYGEWAPTAEAVSESLLICATPGEVMEDGCYGQRICYFTLRGILWALRQFGSEPHPYRHMTHPGEVLAHYRAGLRNK